VTINFDGYWRFSTFIAIGEYHFNVSEKGKRSRQLNCVLIVCGFKISVLFIFGSVWGHYKNSNIYESVCAVSDNYYSTYL
jgi:hypothetical protein